MLQVQLHSWYMENLLSHVFAQVKWTYNPKYTREVFRSEDDIKVLNIVGGIRMEFTCDDAAINVFSIHTRESSGTKTKKSSSQRPLVVAFPDGTTLRGHYTYHADKIHTHFRFSPTTDGMLHLLKLIDFSMAQVMKLV